MAKLNATMFEVSTEIDNLNDALDIPAYLQAAKMIQEDTSDLQCTPRHFIAVENCGGQGSEASQRISSVTETLDSKLQPVNAWLKKMETTVNIVCPVFVGHGSAPIE